MNLPLRLTPAFKDYLWGGTKLRDNFGKNCSLDRVAESWELSCHEDGPSYISGTSTKLIDYISENGQSVLGTNCSRFDSFPVLVKLIDARDNLSVQVHPDDEYALKNEGEYGKNEMWYILDCEEGASIIYGLKESISRDRFSESISDGTFLHNVNYVPVKKGDVFFIEAGTIHAIGKGIVIAEIQQNSNSTYRIFDYNRKDSSGKTRELHTDKACEVTRLSPALKTPEYETVKHAGYNSRILGSCSCFTTQLLTIESEALLETDESSFEHLLVTEGKAILEGTDCRTELVKGDSIFIPAGYGRYSVTGNCLIIKTRID